MFERGIDVAQEHLPVALVDAEPAMRQLHLASHVVERAARGRTQEVDEQLLFTAYAVLAAMLPEAAWRDKREQFG